MLLMSAIGGILMTALLHGDLVPVLCSGFQYWVMMPVFFNMLQVNAFCNADDISWGTKNLDKSGNHEAVKTKSKKLAYRVRPTRTSRAFWQAMGDLQAHLQDQSQVRLYNARKEAKLRAFASYLLIGWVGTNVILVSVIIMVSNYEWESCAITESEMAVSAIRTQADDYDKALAIADLVQTAVTILQRGCEPAAPAPPLRPTAAARRRCALPQRRAQPAPPARPLTASPPPRPPVRPAAQLYPFDGLQGFPQAYPMLVSGDAQANTARGSRVTVLANATELFNNLDQSMPKFEEWLAEAMGINATATLGEFNQIWLPMPSNTTGFDTSVTCKKEFGYQYYLQAQFLLLMFIIIFQVGGSILFITFTWWRRFTGAAFGSGSNRAPPAREGMDPDGKILDTDDEDDESDFEVAVQPSNARYVASHRGHDVPSSTEIDTATDSGSYTPTSAGSGRDAPMRRRNGGSPRYVD